jgi:hypothetical protein
MSANGGKHAWTAEGRISGQSAAGNLRPELRLAASMFDATPSRADPIPNGVSAGQSMV